MLSRSLSLVMSLAVLGGTLGACSRPTDQQNPSPSAAAPSPAANQQVPRIGLSELLAELKTKDLARSVEALNVAKGMSYQSEVIPLVARLWTGDVAGLEGIDATFIAQPRIRLEMADLLAQASANGWKDLAPTEYASYARAHVSDSDPEVARQALLVLGVVREPRDIPLLSKFVSEGNPATAQAAASSLMRICAFDEVRAQALERELKNQGQKEAYARMWDAVQVLRQHTCPKD
jgi:HEAT repeats